MGRQDLRVLHCPWNIGGQASALAAAEREIGLRSTSVAWTAGAFDFQPDEMAFPGGTSLFQREMARFSLLRRGLTESDVVHFSWGDTIFPSIPFGVAAAGIRDWKRWLVSLAIAALWRPFRFIDLRLLRASKKVLAMTFQGDDARQGDWQLKNVDNCIARAVDPSYYTPTEDAWKRKRIAAYEKHVDLIYALNPDLLHVLPPHAKFLPYATVDPRKIKPEISNNRIPVLLHAPSNRAAKGTAIIMQVLDRLKNQGVKFELRLIEGLSHADAMKQYAEADLLVDQLHAGFYGSLAVELMALGKPVVCYLREGDRKFMPPGMWSDMPIVKASPESLETVLKDLLEKDPGALANIGVYSRSFVERWHDPIKIARDVASDYRTAIDRIR